MKLNGAHQKAGGPGRNSAAQTPACVPFGLIPASLLLSFSFSNISRAMLFAAVASAWSRAASAWVSACLAFYIMKIPRRYDQSWVGSLDRVKGTEGVVWLSVVRGRERGGERAHSRSGSPSEVRLEVCGRSSFVGPVLDLSVVGILPHLQAGGWRGRRGSVVDECSGRLRMDRQKDISSVCEGRGRLS
jgi:hypothetical protein